MECQTKVDEPRIKLFLPGMEVGTEYDERPVNFPREKIKIKGR